MLNLDWPLCECCLCCAVRLSTVADNVHFGGTQLEQGKWWVIITACFDHADWPHLVNSATRHAL
eukprot:SAG11_NODE_14938_length_594_cov_1.036364_1_plen_63_part_10